MQCQCNGVAGPTGNLVYLNKIYDDRRDTSCPLLYNLQTTPATFTQQLNIGGRVQRQSCSCGCNGTCGCNGGCGGNCRNACCNDCCGGCNDCCCNFALSENSVFEIDNTYIVIKSFRLSSAANLAASDITVDGFAVSDLSVSPAGQHVAGLSGIMDQITKCPCAAKPVTCTCLPTDNCNLQCDNDGHFFLAQVPGPWVLEATIVLEGTVRDGGAACQFKLCMDTVQGVATDALLIPGSNNFALYCVEIPCQTSGISPTLIFDFDACASLMNPELTVTCTGTECSVNLNATLVLTPEIHLQVTKPALFNLNATEVPVACDNIGQCDPCSISNESCGCGCGCARERDCGCAHDCECGANTASGCGCEGASSPTRTATCTSCNPSSSFACQCCETNGFLF